MTVSEFPNNLRVLIQNEFNREIPEDESCFKLAFTKAHNGAATAELTVLVARGKYQNNTKWTFPGEMQHTTAYKQRNITLWKKAEKIECPEARRVAKVAYVFAAILSLGLFAAIDHLIGLCRNTVEMKITLEKYHTGETPVELNQMKRGIANQVNWELGSHFFVAFTDSPAEIVVN